MRKKQSAICPVETTLGVIGGKWKAVILFHLMREPVLRFNQFQRLLSKVTAQMLTAQLRELEADGLIHREVYPQVPPKVEYSLTPFGKSLTPVVDAMMVWGDHFNRLSETK